MINHPADPGGDMVEPPDAPNGLRIPFIFVPRGDPLPTQWIAEHPDWFTVPAVMVPRNSDNSRRPWAEVQALPRQTDAAWGTLPNPPGGMAAPGIPGSFAPPPAREKRMRDGQPWPKDRNGGDWPADRWGRPTRPLWDYPPGMRAPGEPGSVSEAEAIASARVALAALDPANLRAILASGRTGAGMDGTQTPARGVASRYPGAYDVAEADVPTGASPEAGTPAAAAKTPAQKLRAAEEAAYDASPDDCSGAVRELLRRMGISFTFGNANDFMTRVAGGNSGWRQVTMEESSQLANEGKVVIGGLADPHGHGHILATEPGPWQAAGGFMANGKMARVTPEKYPPAMSSSLGSYQGAKSRGEKTVYDAWGPEYFPQVTFWVHE